MNNKEQIIDFINTLKEKTKSGIIKWETTTDIIPGFFQVRTYIEWSGDKVEIILSKVGLDYPITYKENGKIINTSYSLGIRYRNNKGDELETDDSISSLIMPLIHPQLEELCSFVEMSLLSDEEDLTPKITGFIKKYK